MIGLLLDDRERRRFGEYCWREAEAMDKLTLIPKALEKHFQFRAAAYALVAKEMLDAESFTVGKGDGG
jgi:hypothetical protein